jgi:hypothetical protein
VPHVVDEITLTGLPDVIKNSFDFGIAFDIRWQGKGAHMDAFCWLLSVCFIKKLPECFPL